MKYIYIISVILSSFFTISSSQAKNNLMQYAFYIPQNAFQSNTIEKPQTIKTNNNISTQEISIPNNKSSHTVTKKTTSPKPQNIKSGIKTQKTSVSDFAKKKLRPKIKSKPITSKKKPLFEDTVSKITVYNKTKKSISETLSEIPYPDTNLPKYKNAYLDYIMSLRILYRTKKLQPNFEQEETLSKANTIKRFKI